MKWVKLRTADNPVEAGFVRGLLEAAGIPVQVRSMELWTAAVEIYFAEGARPSVWVPEAHLERAEQVLDEQASVRHWPDWSCRRCGTRMEGQFTACWRCGAGRDDPDDYPHNNLDMQ